MADLAAQDLTFALVVTALDADFYLRAYPDVDAAGLDPVSHYIAAGWREGRDPAPWFSSAAYLEDHPDVAAAGRNPLAHFLQFGAQEGRLARPSSLARLRREDVAQSAWSYEPAAPAPPAPADPGLAPVIASAPPEESTYELVAEAFDRRFYLAENPDVAESGGDPLTHFLESGWREARDPAPWFSVADYLELNPDVAASGMHPFVHYLQAGRQEGRAARLDLGFRYKIIAALQPLEARIEAREHFDERVEPGDAEALAALLAQSRSGLADLHLTFSHDDYAANLGGVQLCLQREAAAAAATGRDHLHVYPFNHRPMLRRPGHAEPVGLVWNGVNAGAFSVPTLVEGLEAALAEVAPGRRSLAVHSLLGHSVSDALAITRSAGLSEGWFWVHDFASACASYHLLRNDVADCGAPPVGSAACGVCIYNDHRQFHLDEHERLFRALSLSVAAPSQAALDTWRRGAGHPAKQTVVAPLARLVPRSAAGTSAGAGEARPFRLAFPGLPSPLKGWPVFRDLVLKYAEDPRYEFLHLARDPAAGLPLTFHSVTVTEDQPQAMQGALEALEVDAVMIWSLCRETFSFTTHEAAAAGAAILTGPDSGNVAAFVEATGRGEVIANETALFDLFETGEITRLARARRAPILADLAYSRLTIDLLDGEIAR
ncbi:MAG: hypothetical protein Q8L59_13935 [Phenylobacterium sp.]|uniref:hypothetical protein n=1 Tax=Phenylobacterium sp. TaxID=1871053 RepID=UPI0027376C36|nr:hypothetical protein [Phenylobacterium sp.]MDP1643271.1 hypothetical protein [Phenylobacterium sp.]MDP3116225.1 hypothetical protein [Phenylobacterium sp.]